ncbi:hypothetical protein VTN77DRAFT_8370 [Rasamsonia byssochlamydoides]|uniref:uncharacterized protein n=1 Tax=Rasamsonia byssochlamydoides TaxID=89139 RepID=UPI00374415B7
MELNTASAGRPAPYGRACLNCARAKCKCILRSVGSCERCHRLNKECVPSPTVRKRKPKTTAASQTARLEQKLDGLVSLLKSATRVTPTVDNATAAAGWNFAEVEASAQAAAPNPSNVSNHRPMEGIGCGPVANPITLSPLTPGSVSAHVQPFAYALPPDLEPSPEEAEDCLKTFRTRNLKYFPFTYIPESTSSQQLRQEWPFFWLCIMAITTKTVSKQLGLGRAIRQIASQEILVDGERNLDLLFGLLVFVGWGHYQVHSGPIMTVYTHLCMSLVFDLGLHRPLQEDCNRMLRCFSHVHPKIRLPQTRTMEHRRAALACFLLSSSIASYHQKFESMRWSPYLEECLRMLAEKPEYPTDEAFVYQIRLQLIIEKAVPICVRNREVEQVESLRVSILYLKGLQSQLQDVKSKIPPHLENNEILLLQVLATEVAVNEIALSRAPLVSVGWDTDFQALEYLYACLQSIKAWFDVFFKCPPSAYVGFSLLTFAQLGYCIFALHRLSTLNDPAWDTRFVRSTVDFSLVLDRVLNNVHQARAACGWKIGHEEDALTKSTKAITALKSWWESRDVDSVRASVPVGGTPATEEQLPTAGVFPAFDDDDPLLKDILGLWDL